MNDRDMGLSAAGAPGKEGFGSDVHQSVHVDRRAHHLDARQPSHHHHAGATFAYSNFGYAILGRVIERITGTSYVNAVTQLVLQPAGVDDMAIAGNTLAQRKANDVMYYGQSGQNPHDRECPLQITAGQRSASRGARPSVVCCGATAAAV